MSEIINIDDFFKPTSMDVAEKLVGMEIHAENGIYVVSAAKPYHGETRHTNNMPRYTHGGIMVFNMRGFPHFCVSTGTGQEHDYVFVSGILDVDGKETKTGKGVATALGMTFPHDGTRFADFLGLGGETMPSYFSKSKDEASSCLGEYLLQE